MICARGFGSGNRIAPTKPGARCPLAPGLRFYLSRARLNFLSSPLEATAQLTSQPSSRPSPRPFTVAGFIAARPSVSARLITCVEQLVHFISPLFARSEYLSRAHFLPNGSPQPSRERRTTEGDWKYYLLVHLTRLKQPNTR